MYTVGFVNNSEMIITHDDNSRKEKEKKNTTRGNCQAAKGFCFVPPYSSTDCCELVSSN